MDQEERAERKKVDYLLEIETRFQHQLTLSVNQSSRGEEQLRVFPRTAL